MKKRREKGQVDIDLTSMLDVIFIILIVVMCNSVVVASEAKEDARKNGESCREAQEEADDAKNNLGNLSSHLSDYENPDNAVAFVTIYAEYDVSNPSSRTVKLIRGTDPEAMEIKIEPGSEEEAFGSVKEAIESFLKKNEKVPVLLNINTEQILYRDWVRLNSMLDEMDNSNLFIQEEREQQ